MDNDENVNGILGQTLSYIQDDQTWCVRKAAPHDTWQNIFALFTVGIWFLMIFLTAVLAIFLYFLLQFNKIPQMRKNFSYAWLISFGSFVNVSTTFSPRTSSIRILFIFALVYGIIFSAIFSSSLISVLTRPRQSFQVYSVGTAFKNGFRFSTGNVALSHVIASQDEVCINYRFLN